MIFDVRAAVYPRQRQIQIDYVIYGFNSSLFPQRQIDLCYLGIFIIGFGITNQLASFTLFDIYLDIFMPFLFLDFSF